MNVIACPNCICGGGCLIASDDFNRANNTDIDDGSPAGWWEAFGTWSISSNKLVCTTSGGIALCTTTHPDGSSDMFVLCGVEHSTAGSACDIIFAMENIINYYYVRCVFHATAGSGQLQIRRVANGTHSTIAITNTTFQPGNNYSVGVCCQGSNVSIQYQGNSATPLTTALLPSPPVGDGFGLSCNGSGTATFDNLSVEKVEQDCKRCNVTCSARCEESDGLAPSQYQITISSGSIWAGTFIVTHIGACLYRLDFDPPFNDTDQLVYAPHETVHFVKILPFNNTEFHAEWVNPNHWTEYPYDCFEERGPSTWEPDYGEFIGLGGPGTSTVTVVPL